MAYQILHQLFNGSEFRMVRHPLSSGRKKEGDRALDHDGTNQPNHPDTSAPQYGAGGSAPSSPESESAPLDSTQEIVLRSDSDLAATIFGRNAREKVRRCGVAAENMHPDKENWWFLTLTYPCGHIEGMAAIARESGRTVKDLKNWLRQFENGETTNFYVWEKQKRGTLHLHFACYLPEAGSRGFCQERFKLWAIAHIRSLSARTGCNLWVSGRGTDWAKTPEVLQAYAQPVRDGVGRYLAKYVSKNATKKTVESTRFPSPRRWWGASQNLHEKVKELTVVYKELHTSYLSATNRFSILMSKMKLTHPSGQWYYNRLEDCDGETFSLFKVSPCRRLTQFMNTLRRRSQRLMQDAMKAGTACPSEVSESVEAVNSWIKSLDVLLPKGSQSDDLLMNWESLNQSALCGLSSWRLVITEMSKTAHVFQTAATASRSPWKSGTKLENSIRYQKVLWVLHRCAQSPQLLIALLSALRAPRLEYPVEGTTYQQGTLFSDQGY